jgi:phosphoglycerate kinase
MIRPVPVLEDLPDVSGRTVLVRCDFNVPLGSDGTIEDDLRIRSAVPTLRWLLEHGARVRACSHLGRPKGQPDDRYRMDAVRARVDELVGAGAVEVMENLRFDPGEEANDAAFVDRLIEGVDAYVDDAFGAAHRAHASIVGPPSRGLPCAAGRLLAREVEVLGGLLDSPRKPFVAVLGGSKVSDKLGVIDALLAVVDQILVGGGMCFTFLKAMGHGVGGSLLEDDMVETCAGLLDRAAGRIVVPEDIVALSSDGVIGDASAGGDQRSFGRSLPAGWKGLDIGPGTAAVFGDAIAEAGTVFWNGPMGVFEDDRFAAGTRHVAHAMAETRAFTVVGGGDSASALARFGLADDVDFVSTGGGASLELLEHGDLPGLAALRGETKGLT